MDGLASSEWTQSGDVTFTKALDSAYLDTGSSLTLLAGAGEKVQIDSRGVGLTVSYCGIRGQIDRFLLDAGSLWADLSIAEDKMMHFFSLRGRSLLCGKGGVG